MKEKINILFIMPALTYGGAEKVLIDYLNEIDKSVFDVSLYLLFENGPLTCDIDNGVDIKYILPHNNLAMRLSYKFFIKMPARHKKLEFIARLYINHILRRKRFHAIIAFMEGLPAFIVSCMNSTAKKVLWIHTDIIRNHYTLQWFGNREREEYIINKFNDVIFVSYEAQKAFNNEFEKIKPKQSIIENIIPVDKILLLSKETIIHKPKDITRICFVGRLTHVKRIDILLDAIKILKDFGIDNFDVLIVGDGPLKEDLMKKSMENETGRYVRFIGFKKNPYPYIKSSDIIINTSRTEGYPISICEAICLGKAVICTNTTGSNEILDNGKYGILTTHSPNDISKRLSELITDPQLLAHYCHLATERAKHFQKGTIMEKFYSVIS